MDDSGLTPVERRKLLPTPKAEFNSTWSIPRVRDSTWKMLPAISGVPAKKPSGPGFVSFGHEDGLRTEDVRSIFEGIDGALYVVTGVHSRYIHRLEGGHFTAVSPKVPGHTAEWDWGGWGWGQTHFQDHLGQWWIATGRGLLRYPKVKFSDLATTTPELIPGVTNVFRLYEDSKGDIWISAWSGSGRWERSSGRFRVLFNIVPTSFREDRAGNLWAGYWEGGLSRYRNGKQEWIIDPKVPTGSLLSIFLDHAGRIWVGTTHGGLLRFDNPTAAQPLYNAYTTKRGLSSDDVRAITEDRFGRIYFWTGKGVDRLDPGTDTIRHYTEADGLCSTGADHNVAFSERQAACGSGSTACLDWIRSPTGLRSLHPSELQESEFAALIIQSQSWEKQSFRGSCFDTTRIRFRLSSPA
jgi:hypothetical protein